jgi:hypothetical protein
MLNRIKRLESKNPPPDVDRGDWIAEHAEEIESRLNAIWQAVGLDLERFIESVRGERYIPFGELDTLNGKRFCFWPPRNNAERNLISGKESETGREVDSSLGEYFSPVEGDEENRAQPDEVQPVDLPGALAFLESHWEIIAGWVTLGRFRESEIFKNSRRFPKLIPTIAKALYEDY